MIQTSTLTDIKVNGEDTRRFLLWQNGMHVIIEWEMYRFQMVLENELDRLFQRFWTIDFTCDWNGHCVSICTEMMGSHTVMNGMCDTKKGVTSLSVITWSQGYPYFGNLTCRATCRAACHNCHLIVCRRFVSTNSLLFLPFSHLPHILNKQTVATWFLRYLVPLPLKALSKRSKDMLPTDDMGRFFSAMNNAYAIS